MRDTPFADRSDAGRLLGERLAAMDLQAPIVLAIPRGGVIVGEAIARALHAPLDVVLARKIGAPDQPELAVGAVGEDGRLHLDQRIAGAHNVRDDFLKRAAAREIEEIDRRRRVYRDGRPGADVRGRSVILTDDGLATGSTVLAALRVVRSQQPREIIVAVPVASADRLSDVRADADRVVCLLTPADFWAIGEFYGQFEQVSDERVVEALRRAGAGRRGGDQPS